MLIKTGFPNLLHGYDFLCFNLMNYQEFEKGLSKARGVKHVGKKWPRKNWTQDLS